MIINLSGEWCYSLDYEDVGLKDYWYTSTLDNGGFNLPGTTATNNVGEVLQMELDFTKENLRHLRQHYRYVGAAWYQKQVFIPESLDSKVIYLFLERVMFESRVWLNGIEVGRCDSLSTPHHYDLTKYLIFGANNIITIRVDNRDVQKLGPNPSAYTDETQTIWNGIIGKIELQIFNQIYLDNIQVYPNINDSSVKLKFDVFNQTGINQEVLINVTASFKEKELKTFSTVKNLTELKSSFNIDYVLSELHLWNEFTPNLYQLKVELVGLDTKTITFGMREWLSNGKQFLINGEKTFLRGTCDCAIFPLTGHPAMDKAEWERIFKTVKDYGLNHVRYHSWCPPKVAFEVADELGLYLNVEGPMWMDTWNKTLVGQHENHYEYLPRELLIIQDVYGNHPSFVMFSCGNELNGDMELLSQMIKTCKAHDNRRLYTLTSNWDRKIDSADDYFVSQTVDNLPLRGQYKLAEMVLGTEINFDEAVEKRDVPVISHEVGQYSVYPDISEIDKFTGALRPLNYECIKKNLEDKGLLPYAKDFTLGSGELALNLYKDELEAALRTKELAGIQLLDLHDFTGQSTATVGILNAFWESKGITTSNNFQQFCREVVPLALMKKRIYLTSDELSFRIQVANYSLTDYHNKTVSWELVCENKVFKSGLLENVTIKKGGLREVGFVSEKPFVSCTNAKAFKLIIKIVGTDYQNYWDIWVYPDTEEVLEENVIYAEKFDEEVINALAKGKKVVLFPKESEINNTTYGKFFPVFWSPIHFTSNDPCGLIIKEHPLFNYFPTEKYINYQWKDLVENSFSLIIDNLPNNFIPLVQVIPNFYHNAKLTNLFECQVLQGKLLVCTIDLKSNIDNRIVAKNLRNSLYRYVNSNEFNPKQTLTIEDLTTLFTKVMERSTEYINLALNKEACASSEKPLFSASNGNDGNVDTAWCAVDTKNGHYWQVDLGAVYDIYGTEINFSEAKNYLYTINTSVDGVNFKVAVNQTGQTLVDQVRYDQFYEQARYVRVVYNSVPEGVYASHKEVKVLGLEINNDK